MGSLTDLISTIFDGERYMPHGYCLLWQPELVWLHVISDLAIALAYYSIPLTIFYLLRKRGQKMPYKWVFVMFAVFILLCGTSHIVEIVTLWRPVYYFQGIVKVLTAAASLSTALLIFPLLLTLLEQFQKLDQAAFSRKRLNADNLIDTQDLEHAFDLNEKQHALEKQAADPWRKEVLSQDSSS